MRRGDIYLVSLDPTEGHEQRGTRPVLIISTEKFNDAMKLPITLPITNGGNFARIHGFAVSLQGSGTRTTGLFAATSPARWILLPEADVSWNASQAGSSMRSCSGRQELFNRWKVLPSLLHPISYTVRTFHDPNTLQRSG